MALGLAKILLTSTNTGQPGSYWQNANISMWQILSAKPIHPRKSASEQYLIR